MRVTIGRLLAAALLTLCIGVQVLEASGRWDHTFEDTSDEAVIVIVVLCIGAALAAAGTTLIRLCASATRRSMIAVSASSLPPAYPQVPSAFSSSPPLSLRI